MMPFTLRFAFEFNQNIHVLTPSVPGFFVTFVAIECQGNNYQNLVK
jgi:hypothetical protein